jgi:sugar lactone lactonase YvrE
MPRNLKSKSVFIAALLLMATVRAQDIASSSVQIAFHADESYPESVVWSPRQKRFFVGSLHKGTIGTVSMSGEYKAFASDDAMFGSSGIKYDAKRNLVWAAMCDIGLATRSSPKTQGKVGAIIAFDATTGKRRHYIDLAKVEGGRAHCANDLALDPQGNIYVTDSFAPVVYAVDRHFKPRVLVRSEEFTGGNFNLNGIVYHPDGFLLVGKHNSGELFRIELKPKVEVHKVRLTDNIPGADGMELVGRNVVVVAENMGRDRAVTLTTTDGWQTAAVVEAAKSTTSFPVAVTTAEDGIYMLNNRVDTLIDPSAAKVSDYVLQRLPVKPAN